MIKRLIRKDCNQLSIALLGFYAASWLGTLLIGILYSLAWSNSFIFELDVDSYYLLSGALSFLSLAVPFMFYLFLKKENPSKILQFQPVKFTTGFMYVIIGWGLCLASNLPVNFIYQYIDETGINSGVTVQPSADSTLSFILKIIAVSIAPAVFEEFVFRGVVLSKLKKYGASFAIVVSSILFAILHSNLISMPFAFLAGLVMGFIYVKTNNLWITIFIHFLNNAFSIVQEEILNYFTGENAIIVFNVIFYAVIVFAFCFLAYLEYRDKISSNLKNEIEFIGFKTKMFAAFTNPSTIAFVVLCISTLISNIVYYG
ncbi:MAG: type II CAAX endopeptidase family protein [Clostridia bacterium]